MASSEEDQIVQVVMDFLKNADMNVTTERMVVAHVENTLALSKPVSDYKHLVSSTIGEFLESIDVVDIAGTSEGRAADGGDGDGGDSDYRRAKAGSKRSRKQQALDGGDSSGDSDKRTDAKRSRGTDEVLFNKDLSSRRKARVRRWKGKLYVDVREFNTGDMGEAPTQKGLCMDSGQWVHLGRNLPRLVQALRAHNTDAPVCKMSATRLASVRTFKGTYFLGIQELYEKDGQLQPSRKCVTLNLAEAEALLGAAADITTAVGDAGELPADWEGGAQLAAPFVSGGGGAAVSTAAGLPVDVGGDGGGGGVLGGGDGDERTFKMVDLGNQKRVRVHKFRGSIRVDLREFYKKNDQMLPGMKGISLAPEDWTAISDSLREVEAAVKRKDMSYCLQLSGMRRVTVGEFKGVLYVSVREYYDKGGGEMVPGRKGVSMNLEQWGAFMTSAPAITAALQQALAGQ